MGETRKEELLKAIGQLDDGQLKIVGPLIDEAIFLEDELAWYKKLPRFVVHEKDNQKQKALPAGKTYREYLQQYTNVIKTLAGIARRGEGEEESPLRKYMENMRNNEEAD